MKSFTLSLLLTFGLICSAWAGTGQRVIIDAGHGGKDRGAIWGGVHEATLNLRVATMLEKELKKSGIKVTMTRRSDIFISLAKRAEIANRYRKAHFVSIHFNAFTDRRVTGVETFFAGKAGYPLARNIHREFSRSIKIKNRGLRYRPFAVLTKTRHPAALIECGYISNSRERARCNTTSFQSAAAKAIARGIVKTVK